MELLQQEWERLVGGSVWEVDLDVTDRLAMAAQANDEKWATPPVFGQLALVARGFELPIPCIGGTAHTPAGTILGVKLEAIDVQILESVLVVENAALLVDWPAMLPLLPEPCRNSLLIYRGHGQNLAALERWVQTLSKTVKVFGFFDFDPAGMQLATSYLRHDTDALITPNPERIRQWSSLSQDKLFRRQRAILAKAISSSHPAIRSAANLIEQHQLAITQEHLIARRVELIAL